MSPIRFIISVLLVTHLTGASVQFPVSGAGVAPHYEPHSLYHFCSSCYTLDRRLRAVSRERRQCRTTL
jgi:hypothetical protein